MIYHHCRAVVNHEHTHKLMSQPKSNNGWQRTINQAHLIKMKVRSKESKSENETSTYKTPVCTKYWPYHFDRL